MDGMTHERLEAAIDTILDEGIGTEVLALFGRCVIEGAYGLPEDGVAYAVDGLCGRLLTTGEDAADGGGIYVCPQWNCTATLPDGTSRVFELWADFDNIEEDGGLDCGCEELGPDGEPLED